jgi:hypothetical protein
MDFIIGAVVFCMGGIFGLMAASLACAAGKESPRPPKVEEKPANVRVLKDREPEKGTDDE